MKYDVGIDSFFYSSVVILQLLAKVILLKANAYFVDAEIMYKPKSNKFSALWFFQGTGFEHHCCPLVVYAYIYIVCIYVNE